MINLTTMPKEADANDECSLLSSQGIKVVVGTPPVVGRVVEEHAKTTVKEQTKASSQTSACGCGRLWQWCDTDPVVAVEANWHIYTAEHSAMIESAWLNGLTKLLLQIGLTEYEVGYFEGETARQYNAKSGNLRAVRRAPLNTLGINVPADLTEERCALCTEDFGNTPEWPVKRVVCGHAFHHTCLRRLLDSGNHTDCPLCRTPLAILKGSKPILLANAAKSVKEQGRDFTDNDLVNLYADSGLIDDYWGGMLGGH